MLRGRVRTPTRWRPSIPKSSSSSRRLAPRSGWSTVKPMDSTGRRERLRRGGGRQPDEHGALLGAGTRAQVAAIARGTRGGEGARRVTGHHARRVTGQCRPQPTGVADRHQGRRPRAHRTLRARAVTLRGSDGHHGRAQPHVLLGRHARHVAVGAAVPALRRRGAVAQGHLALVQRASAVVGAPGTDRSPRDRRHRLRAGDRPTTTRGCGEDLQARRPHEEAARPEPATAPRAFPANASSPRWSGLREQRGTKADR